MRYEYEFMTNGQFKGRTVMPIQQYGDYVTTYEGRWTLVGNRLTLHLTNHVMTIPESLRSIFSSGRHTLENDTQVYVVLWRNDGSFELRYDEEHLRKRCKNNNDFNMRYDSQGRTIVHYKSEGGFFTSATEYSIAETAKIFRRVSN